MSSVTFARLSSSRTEKRPRRSSAAVRSAALISVFLTIGLLHTGRAQGICPHAEGQIHIPAGAFIYGSTESERELAYALDQQITRPYGWYERETRGRAFTGSYCIDATPVTHRQYRRFVEVTGHRAPYISAEDYQRQGFLVHPYASVKPYLWENGSMPSNLENHPVVLVSLDDAAAYCAWKGRGGGSRNRLPTELEWEKAARGADGQFFPWGNAWDFAALNSGHRVGSTTPVGQFPGGKSPYGVLDMAGNVFEWTATLWHDPLEAQQKKSVLKGCSWDDRPGTCRAAMRHGRPNDSRHILIGFRCMSEVR